MVLEKELELLLGNGCIFEINQLYLQKIQHQWLTQMMKLCKLLSELIRVCERRKLRVNVGMGRVMRCSGFVNLDRMDLN